MGKLKHWLYMCFEDGEIRTGAQAERLGTRCFEGHQMKPLTFEEANAAMKLSAEERAEWAKNGLEIEEDPDGGWKAVIKKR